MFVNDNRILSVYSYFQEKLNHLYSESECRLLANLTLEYILEISRSELLLARESRVSESDLLRIRTIVKELQEEKPIEYILEEAEFHGMRLKVTPAVLIPRPETEELIRFIEKQIPSAKRILDIGTGSGCIPIALKKIFSQAKVYGMDVSEEALEIARFNSQKQDLNIEWLNDSILEPKIDFEEPFDLIVSNPPYVLNSDRKEMRANVLQFEPHLALFVPDEDPLLFYKAIIKFCEKYLKKGGALYFETHEKYAIPIKQLFLDADYISVEVLKDFYGKDRIVKGVK